MLKWLQNNQRFPGDHSALRKVRHMQLWGWEKSVQSPTPLTLGCPKEPETASLCSAVFPPLKANTQGLGAQIQHPSPNQNTTERGLTPRTIILFSFKNIRYFPTLLYFY